MRFTAIFALIASAAALRIKSRQDDDYETNKKSLKSIFKLIRNQGLDAQGLVDALDIDGSGTVSGAEAKAVLAENNITLPDHLLETIWGKLAGTDDYEMNVQEMQELKELLWRIKVCPAYRKDVHADMLSGSETTNLY